MSMKRSAIRVLGVAGGAAVALLALAVLGLPRLAPAQQPPAPAAGAQLPAGYAGAEACKACHEEVDQKFAATKMGKIQKGPLVRRKSMNQTVTAFILLLSKEAIIQLVVRESSSC